MSVEKFILPNVAEGLGLGKDILHEKKTLFFKWMEAPKSTRKPKFLKDVEHSLKISHVTACKWKAEYEKGLRVGDKVARISTTPEEITSLLVKKLDQIKTIVADDASVNDPKRVAADMVQLGLWSNMSHSVDKMASLITHIEDPSLMLNVMERLTGVLKKVDDIASGAAPRLGKEVQQEHLAFAFGTLTKGMSLPGAEAPPPPRPALVPSKSAPEVVDVSVEESAPDRLDEDEEQEQDQDLADVGLSRA